MSGRTAGASGEISFTADLSDNKNAATKVAALGDLRKNWFYNKCWGSEAERPSYAQHFSLLLKKE